MFETLFTYPRVLRRHQAPWPRSVPHTVRHATAVHLLRNLSTTLRHRRLRFTEQSLLLWMWMWQVG